MPHDRKLLIRASSFSSERPIKTSEYSLPPNVNTFVSPANVSCNKNKEEKESEQPSPEGIKPADLNTRARTTGMKRLTLAFDKHDLHHDRDYTSCIMITHDLHDENTSLERHRTPCGFESIGCNGLITSWVPFDF